MSIYIIGVFATLLLYLIVGNYAGTKVKNLDDYYVSGRSAPTLLILGTLVASYLSTNTMLGETGFSYDGYPALLMWNIAINAIGYVLGAYFFGRYIRRSQALTVPEYFRHRFNSRKVQMAAGITVVVGITAYLLAVTQGATLLMSELLGVSEGWAMLIVWAVYTSFTFYGGSRGVIITDTIMFFIFMIVLFVATPFVVNLGGGWAEVLTRLANFEGVKAGIASWHSAVGPGRTWATPGAGITWAIIIGTAWMGVVMVSPWQTSRYLMAKNEHVVLRSAFLAGVSILLLYIPIAIIGSATNLINPGIENGEKVFLWLAFNKFPAWLGILVLAGILAAALSSASTFLSLVGFSVTRDIIGERATKDEKIMLRFSRIVMLCCGLVTLVICYFQPPALFWLTYFAGTVFAASWGPTCLLSIYSKRITAEGAFWGIIVGFVANSATKFGSVFLGWSLPVWADPFVIGLVCGLLAILIASSLTKVTEEEKAYREKLFKEIPLEEYQDQKEVKRTMLFPKITIGVSLAVILLLVFAYALPYARI